MTTEVEDNRCTMTTEIDNRCNKLSSFLHRTQVDQFMKPNVQEHSFMLKKSRKGMHLNKLEEFYRTPVEQSFIKRISILSTGGCCDEYVILRKNAYNRQMIKENMFFREHSQYTPSVAIIDVGSKPQDLSSSTLSITPSLSSEKPCVLKTNIVQSDVHYLGNKNSYENKKSKEQLVINYNEPENRLSSDIRNSTTEPPKISPLKSCWRFLTCKKKKNKEDPYLPTAETQNKLQYSCTTCPNSNHMYIKVQNSGKHNSHFSPHRLNTIAESEVTVGDHKSDDLVTKDNKVKGDGESKNTVIKEKKPGTESDRDNLMTIPTKQSDEKMYQWICKPIRNFTPNAKQQYICFRDQ